MEKQPGKKHKQELKEKAFALLVCNNASYVAKQLGLPYSTVKTWEDKFIKEGKKQLEGKKQHEGETSTTTKDSSKNLVELREKKKLEFVDNAWQLIEDSLAVVQKRMSRARHLEEQLDRLANAIKENADKITEETGIMWFDLLDVVKEIKSFKSPKLSELSTLIGTIYDKQALANGEATSREETVIKGFEDY